LKIDEYLTKKKFDSMLYSIEWSDFCSTLSLQILIYSIFETSLADESMDTGVLFYEKTPEVKNLVRLPI
jgi:hypothetical protein